MVVFFLRFSPLQLPSSFPSYLLLFPSSCFFLFLLPSLPKKALLHFYRLTGPKSKVTGFKPYFGRPEKFFGHPEKQILPQSLILDITELKRLERQAVRIDRLQSMYHCSFHVFTSCRTLWASWTSWCMTSFWFSRIISN